MATNVISKEKLQNLLNLAEEFYTLSSKEEAIGKLSDNGHLKEHIKTVLERMRKLIDLFNANKTEEMNHNPQYEIDDAVALAVAAYHDIGNSLNRKYHNHLARGIIQGELTYSDILSVPIKSFSKEKQSEYIRIFKEKDTEKISEALKDDRKRTEIIKHIFIPKALFEKGYNDQESDKIIENISGKYNISPDELNLVKKTLDRIEPADPEKLRAITRAFKDCFDINQINKIAEAVQDHNIDYKNDGSRYLARNIYGSLIFDADKDDVAMTFAFRTLAYALNSWTKNSDKFINNGLPDFRKCVSHILHQSWERFRINCFTAPHKDIHTYKHLDDINGVKEVKTDERVNEYIQKGMNEQDAIERVAKEKGYLLCKVPENPIENNEKGNDIYFDAGNQFYVLSANGADTHSQIDTIFTMEKGEICTPYMDQKEEFNTMASFWANPEFKEECMEPLEEIAKTAWFQENSTMEAIVNVAESLKYLEGETNITPQRLKEVYEENKDIDIGTFESELNDRFTYQKIVEDVLEDYSR